MASFRVPKTGDSGVEPFCVRLYRVKLALLTLSALSKPRIHKRLNPGEFYLHDLLETEGT